MHLHTPPGMGLLPAIFFVVVVVGALFAVANIGGVINNTYPSCTILGQLQTAADHLQLTKDRATWRSVVNHAANVRDSE